jgi:hypothetical protein
VTTTLRLSYGRCRMSSRMKANTTLYILLLDATWIVRMSYDRCRCLCSQPYSSGTVKSDDQSQSHLMTDVNPTYETLCIFNIVPKVTDNVHYNIHIMKRWLSKIFRRPLYSSMEYPRNWHGNRSYKMTYTGLNDTQTVVCMKHNLDSRSKISEKISKSNPFL